MLGGNRKRRGQALIELLASVSVFFMLIGASLSYFRYMRSMTIRQEVVRNLAFAKMNNNGALISENDLVANSSPPPKFLDLTGLASDINVLGDAQIASDSACIDVVFNGQRVPAELGGFNGVEKKSVSSVTRATVFRVAKSNCD